MNARSIIQKNGRHIIGTDHGLFRSTTSKNYLEWQPSSNTHTINHLWTEASNSDLIYACGDNGVILKSEDDGGSTVPLVQLSAIGACVNGYPRVEYFVGSSNSCQWLVDDEVVSNNCSRLIEYIHDSGEHVITLKGENSYGEISTVSKSVFMVDPPMANLPTIIVDTILCHEEPLNILIENTEDNIKYCLRKTGSTASFGSSNISNGGSLSFITNPINTSGEYYLVSEHSLAQCETPFTDTFNIVVEKTEATFVSEFINAAQNEIVEFNETTVDAQNFSWQFSPAASIEQSTQPSPKIMFEELGETTIGLIACSNHLCCDTIEASGPFIFDVPSNAPACWTLVHSGVDIYNGQYEPGQFPGDHDPETTDLFPHENGFLTCGHFNDQVFNSRWGTTRDLDSINGSYLTFHDQ